MCQILGATDTEIKQVQMLAITELTVRKPLTVRS